MGRSQAFPTGIFLPSAMVDFESMYIGWSMIHRLVSLLVMLLFSTFQETFGARWTTVKCPLQLTYRAPSAHLPRLHTIVRAVTAHVASYALVGPVQQNDYGCVYSLPRSP